MPDWDISLSTTQVPGEPMVISGVIYDKDGKTPLAGTRVYVYHTDAGGEYGPNGNSDPLIKGTMITDEKGRFRFASVRPGAYPMGGVPAHVHVHVSAPGKSKRVAEFHFQGDPELGQNTLRLARSAGTFTPVITLSKRDGIWQGGFLDLRPQFRITAV